MAHLYASFADASLAEYAAGALLNYGAGRSVGSTDDGGWGGDTEGISAGY